MEFEVDLLGQQYYVYDIENSSTVKSLKEDVALYNPFQHIPEDPKVIVDIGANVGMWAFWVAKKYPLCRVYAVEPHPVNLLNLQMGILRNKLSNITVLPCAVSNKPELVMLWMSAANSGATGVFNYYYANMIPQLAAALPLNTLFESLDKHNVIDHVKVDIEGPEFTAFEGFRYWDRIKSLWVEAHPFPQFRELGLAQKKLAAFKAMIAANMHGKTAEVRGEVKEEWFI